MLNQVYVVGWLNEMVLNCGYFGFGEKMLVIVLDNQFDGSVDIGVINYCLLVGIDYQDCSNYIIGYYGVFLLIDVFNFVYGVQLDYIMLYSCEKYKLWQIGYYLQDQMLWDCWCFMLGGCYDWVSVFNIDKFYDLCSDFDKNNVSICVVLFYLFDNGVVFYFSYFIVFMLISFVDENGNVLELMKGKQWEVGVKYELLGGNSQFSVVVYCINQINIVIKEEFIDLYCLIGEIEFKGVELEVISYLLDSVCLQVVYIYIDICYKKSSL